jgi:hypothetical protein
LPSLEVLQVEGGEHGGALKPIEHRTYFSKLQHHFFRFSRNCRSG